MRNARAVNGPLAEAVDELPAGGVGHGGRDHVQVGAAERVDDGRHAPVQQVASHIEHL